MFGVYHPLKRNDNVKDDSKVNNYIIHEKDYNTVTKHKKIKKY